MTESTITALKHSARMALHERGFRGEFLPGVTAEATAMTEPDFGKSNIRDLSAWLWSSIDNDDSRDLDQIEFIEQRKDGWRIYVAVADVSVFVQPDSLIDRHARHNTASIYSGVQVFPMLPERLSTNLTSLNEDKKRLAIVIEFDVDKKGRVTGSNVYPAAVRNRAQLTYDAAHAWITSAPEPHSDITKRKLERIRKDQKLQDQLRMQDDAAQRMRKARFESGALDFQAPKLEARIAPEGKVELDVRLPTRATQLIEELMVAANESVDSYLAAKGFPCFQRIVRTPKNWPRMVELAKQHGAELPAEPDGKALQAFLADQRKKEPQKFADLSFAMVKLLGRGEYIVRAHGEEAIGHFGLATPNYSHSTAPNRRYPDLITQRLLHAAFDEAPLPYPLEELREIARHCTAREDDANRVERQVQKCVAAVALTPRIGESFTGIITGASSEGVWIRVSNPPVEGKVQEAPGDIGVGDMVSVTLVQTNPIRGFLDFKFTTREPA